MNDKIGTLNVSGTGKVQVAPDEAVIDLTVITEAGTAADAAAANARSAQAVIDAVSAQPNHGVTTMGLSVNPIYARDSSTGPSRIVGFRATNGVEVKTKIAYAGQIYDAGIKAGANESSGITFRIQNEVPHREEALRLAVKDAYREAKIVASAAHIELLGPEAINISSGGLFFYRSKGILEGEVTTPVLPEERTITANVQITFRTRR
jgi:uncharacterized protein YggE